jgi:hypothetical protein
MCLPLRTQIGKAAVMCEPEYIYVSPDALFDELRIAWRWDIKRNFQEDTFSLAVYRDSYELNDQYFVVSFQEMTGDEVVAFNLELLEIMKIPSIKDAWWVHGP